MEPQYNEVEYITSDGHGAEIAAIIFAVIICASVAYFFSSGNVIKNKKENNIVVGENSSVIKSIDPFITISLQAKSAYVWDIKNQKVIYNKNADYILPLASITKIMTADVASEILTPTTTISIQKENLMQEGDSGLFVNEKWTFKKLLDFTLAVSSNDGASAIASAASPNFVEIMNQKAKSLGLNSMKFYNPTGLDETATRSGAYGSAIDVAKLFLYTLQNHPDIFTATRSAKFTIYSLDNLSHFAVNTDAAINNIPGIIGSKTGYSALAGGNLAIIYDASINYPVIIVVLGSTYDGRFDDINKLIGATNQALSLQK